MNEFNRRKFLEGSAGVAAAASFGTGAALLTPLARAQTLLLKPDPSRAHLFDAASGQRLVA